MPRKTRPHQPHDIRIHRFNEAAARCRGKLQAGGRDGRTQPASMRPRPDAAENPPETPFFVVWEATASMRPRPDAAENVTCATRAFAESLMLQ